MRDSRFSILFALYLLLISQAAGASQEGAQSFTFDGRAFADSAATLPLLDTISLKIQILNQAQDCVIYEESQTVNTTTTNGYFTIQMGSVLGSPKRTAGDSAHSMSAVFSNTIASLSGKLLSNGSACTYSPVNAQVRYFRLQMTPAIDGVLRTITPNMALDAVPNAMVAERAENLQGFYPTDLILVNNTAPATLNQANLESVFSTTNFPRLTSLLSVAPSNYVQTGANGSALLPVVAGNPGSGLASGQIWYDSSANVLKYYDGAVKTIGTSGAATGPIVDNVNSASTAIAVTQSGSGFAGTFTGGNVGIGTTNPLYSLHVGPGNQAASLVGLGITPQAFLTSNGNSGLAVRDATNGIEVALFTASGSASGVLSTTTAHSLNLRANNSPGLSVQPNSGVALGTFGGNYYAPGNGLIIPGALGVGTFSPINVLQVSPLQYNAGTASQSGTTVTGSGTAWTSAMIGSLFTYANGVSAGLITAVANGTSLTVSNSLSAGAGSNYAINYLGLNVNSTGNVGIGTTAPVQNLEVIGANASFIKTSNGLNNLFMGATTAAGAFMPYSLANDAQVVSYGALDIGTQTNAGISIGTNNLLRMTVLGGGNVGIGVANPSVSLDVVGGVRAGSSTVVTACGMGAINGEGSQRYNYTSHNMEFCNGSGWQTLNSASAGGITPGCGATGSLSSQQQNTLNVAAGCTVLLKVWGGAAANATAHFGGAGGYASITLGPLASPTTYYLVVGGGGTNSGGGASIAGYSGGAPVGNAGGGGGASGVWTGGYGVTPVVVAAGGGGGSANVAGSPGGTGPQSGSTAGANSVTSGDGGGGAGYPTGGATSADNNIGGGGGTNYAAAGGTTVFATGNDTYGGCVPGNSGDPNRPAGAGNCQNGANASGLAGAIYYSTY